MAKLVYPFRNLYAYCSTMKFNGCPRIPQNDKRSYYRLVSNGITMKPHVLISGYINAIKSMAIISVLCHVAHHGFRSMLGLEM